MRGRAVTGLLVLASFYTLYLAREFFLPLVLAFLLALLLRPPVRLLRRLRVPEKFGAGLVLLLLLALLGGATWQLSGPASTWLARAPQTLAQMERALRDVKRPVEDVRKATDQMERITSVDGEAPRRVVQVTEHTLGDHLMIGTQEVVWRAVVVIFLLYFLLASGDLFLRKTVRLLPRLEDKKRAVEIARQVEKDISTYLFTITMINVGLGVATAAVLSLEGMPNPALWGALAGLLNFIPYLGAGVTAGILFLVALVTLDSTWWALAVATSFWGLTVVEGYLVTPMVLSRRLTLNPVGVFIGMTFWGWLWGIGGVLLAVPILAVAKIVCDHVEAFAPVGEYLGP